MAYSQIVKNEAFLLYCLGYSLEGVVRKLIESHPKECNTLNRSTLQGWSAKGRWENRRLEEQKRIEKDQTQDASLLIRTAREKIQDMVPGMLDEIKDMGFSSKEGGVYAVNALLKSYREFSGESNPPILIQGEEEVILFLEVLNSIPEIKMLIEKYKPVIGEKLDHFKKKAESEKLIGDQDGHANEIRL